MNSLLLSDRLARVLLVLGALTAAACGKTESDSAEPEAYSPEAALAEAVEPLEATSLCAGMQKVCASDLNGEVWCWGNVLVGGVSEAPSRQPIRIDAAQGLRGLTCGMGRVGGIGEDGALGTVRRDPQIEWSDDYPAGVSAVAFGQTATCVLDEDDVASCYGGGVSVWQLSDARSVHAEEGTACALAYSGEVYCTGEAYWVADTVTDWPSGEPVALPEVHDAAHLAMNDAMLCVATSDGLVRCWVREVHVKNFVDGESILGMTDIIQVAVSANAVCGLTGGGDVLCAGGNSRGQLGTDAVEQSAQALTVDLPPIRQIVGSSAGATCALSEGNHIYCWGDELLTRNGSNAVSGDAFHPVVIDIGNED